MMIRFACICDHRFELPVEQAGAQLQCPHCMRLVDVPQLNELSAFEEDGTLRMEAAEENDSHLNSKVRAFSHRQDLRTDLDTFLNIGVPTTGPKTAKPRYDPITGELLRPIAMRDDATTVVPQDVPMAKPVLGYNTGATEATAADLKWWQVPWRLLTGHSLIAISFVVLAHVLVGTFLLLPIANLFLIPAAVVLAIAVIAHYGNVIDQIGPQNRDDVPVLLRGVSFTEDIRIPFVCFMSAALLCFWPVIVLKIFTPAKWMQVNPWAEVTLLAIGVLSFPAAFLTANASGALENLWPPRVARVIFAAPFRYGLALLAFCVGMAAYYVFAKSLHVTSNIGLLFGNFLGTPQSIAIDSISQTTAAIVATYCMHLAAAWLAMIYRDYHVKFRWVLQVHVKRPRDDTLARLAALRQNGDPRVRPARRPAATPAPARRVLPVVDVPMANAGDKPQPDAAPGGFEVKVPSRRKAK